VARHERSAAGQINLGEPACLILAMVLHFMDAPTARDLVRAYVDELAVGSYVIITVTRREPAVGDQITRAYDAATVRNHSPNDVTSFRWAGTGAAGHHRRPRLDARLGYSRPVL
jgi:hypothetical protein